MGEPVVERVAAAHTPGPWFVDRRYEASRTVAIMRDFVGPNVALAVHGPQNWIQVDGAAEQIEANARLIAAAPDLLAALKEIVADRHACGTMRHRAEAAIAKAEGK